MDEPLKTIVTALGTVIAVALLNIASYGMGKVNSKKDAVKLAIETDSQRNRSEETFRSSFAEQKVKSDKLERQMRYLYRKNKSQEKTIKELTEQVDNLIVLVNEYKSQVETLQDHIAVVENERDALAAQLKGVK